MSLFELANNYWIEWADKHWLISGASLIVIMLISDLILQSLLIAWNECRNK